MEEDKVKDFQKNWQDLIRPTKLNISSIQGPAITSIKIDGVLHEFSSLPGVKEDVTEIILNLKGIELKMHSYDTQTITVSASGECNIKAGDIILNQNVEA